MKSKESDLKNIRFVRYGDLVMINETSLPKLGYDLSCLQHCDDKNVLLDLRKRFHCSRLAIKSYINDDDFRSPNVIILGDDRNPWVVHVDNGVKYCFDITKSMFCKGNIKEKMRLAKIDCSNEVVVDLFAGIGYFAMVFAVHCRAKMVYCCEWNPVAVEALKRNATLNKVQDCVRICEGDNRIVCPIGVANRVNMGLIPSSLASLQTACRALDPNHSELYLHIHENLNYLQHTNNLDSEQSNRKDSIEEVRLQFSAQIIQLVSKTISQTYPDIDWNVRCQTMTCIKPYAPHIDHMVIDICCTKNKC